jgi:hypothetical protein
MYVEETFYRRDEVAREPRALPAATYNLAHVLLARATSGCLFVPIRSMQYLAVLDNEEFIFVDREGGRMIEIAWQHFRPRERTALDEPVAYEAVYYSASGAQIMARLQSEFHKALVQLEHRAPAHASARIVKLPLRGS